jgi:hypothetical protein
LFAVTFQFKKRARISPPRSTPIRCVGGKITMPPSFSKPESIFEGYRPVGRLEEMGWMI